MSGLGESIVSFAWNEGHAEARTSQSPPRYLILISHLPAILSRVRVRVVSKSRGNFEVI